MAQPKQQRRARSGWSEKEYQMLWDEVNLATQEGYPLKNVFDTISQKTGRKPNSVRNFYYATVKTKQDDTFKRKNMPFVPFSSDEVSFLLREVLQARAQGESVRACVSRLSGGDRALMLRYQNKYRALLKAQPEAVQSVITDLRESGMQVSDPFITNRRRKSESEGEGNLSPMEQFERNLAAPLGAQQAHAFVESLQTLGWLASQRTGAHRKSDEADKLAVRVDLLRMDVTRMDEQMQSARQIARELANMAADNQALAAKARSLMDALAPRA